MEILPEILGAIIVLAPIVIFLFVMLKLLARLKEQKIHLSDLLSETEVEIKKQETKEGEQAGQTPTTKRSASRFILFLSGITSLILGACITTYYFYMNIYQIAGNADLKLGDFTGVLLALGIGVVPYAVNQVKRIRL